MADRADRIDHSENSKSLKWTLERRREYKRNEQRKMKASDKVIGNYHWNNLCSFNFAIGRIERDSNFIEQTTITSDEFMLALWQNWTEQFLFSLVSSILESCAIFNGEELASNWH